VWSAPLRRRFDAALVLDGNGRLGRLLIVLQLVADGVLREPIATSNSLVDATRLTPATVNKFRHHRQLSFDFARLWPVGGQGAV